MPLLRDGHFDPAEWQEHASGETPSARRWVTAEHYGADPEGWNGLAGEWAGVVEPDADLDALPAGWLEAPRLAVRFPVFTDGRGYSQARLLRRRGFAGELIAIGDVRRDQIDFMAQVGFDSFACPVDADLDSWRAALGELRVGVA